MAHSHHGSGTRSFLCARILGLAISLLMVPCVAFAGSKTVTANCRVSASAGGPIGSFTVKGRASGPLGPKTDSNFAHDSAKKGLERCLRDALGTRGFVARSCTERQNYGRGHDGYTQSSEIRGWRWSGSSLQDLATRIVCGGGLNPSKEVRLWVACTPALGPTARTIWQGGRCPGRPAPKPLPNLPPPPSSQEQQQQQQQELSLVCQNGAVVNGQCRCVPGSRPQLIGPRAYRCVRGPR